MSKERLGKHWILSPSKNFNPAMDVAMLVDAVFASPTKAADIRILGRGVSGIWGEG